jgi:hypothetical protein
MSDECKMQNGATAPSRRRHRSNFSASPSYIVRYRVTW